METAQFTEKDFKDSKYNILAIRKKTVLESYPYFKNFPEFTHDFKKEIEISNDLVIRYSLLMYSKNIIDTIPDLWDRKRESLLLAGFKAEGNPSRFSKEIEDLVMCQYPLANDLFIRVGRMNHDDLYLRLCVYEEARANEMKRMVNADSENIKNIHIGVRTISEDISEIKKQLLSMDNSPDLIDRLYFHIEQGQAGIRPEEIAQARRDGSVKEMVGDYYGQEVSPDDIPNYEQG